MKAGPEELESESEATPEGDRKSKRTRGFDLDMGGTGCFAPLGLPASFWPTTSSKVMGNADGGVISSPGNDPLKTSESENKEICDEAGSIRASGTCKTSISSDGRRGEISSDIKGGGARLTGAAGEQWGSQKQRGRRGTGRGIGAKGVGNGRGQRGASWDISTPRILAILCKVSRLMTALTLVLIRAVSGFMSPFTNCTLEGLTSVPNTAGETLDVTLEGDVLLQCHTDNPGGSGDLLEAGKVLLGDAKNVAKGGKCQANPGVTGLHRHIVHV